MRMLKDLFGRALTLRYVNTVKLTATFLRSENLVLKGPDLGLHNFDVVERILVERIRWVESMSALMRFDIESKNTLVKTFQKVRFRGQTIHPIIAVDPLLQIDARIFLTRLTSIS